MNVMNTHPSRQRPVRAVAAALATVVIALIATVCFAAPAAHAAIPSSWAEAPASLECLQFDVPTTDKTLLYWGDTQFPVAAFVDGAWVSTTPTPWTLIDTPDAGSQVSIATWIRPTGMVVAPCVNPFAPTPSPNPTAPAATDGVNLFSASLDSGAVPQLGTCFGEPGTSPTADTVQIADRFGEFVPMGTNASSLIFNPGNASEVGQTPTEDSALEEVTRGLSTINDFGYFPSEGDDDANAWLGSGGSLTVKMTDNNGRSASVRADGVTATGQLGTNPNTPGDNLDGHEIFIFEDGELAGMNITLHPSALGQSSYTITVADLELNPDPVGAADDIMIAIDLDSLPADAPRSVGSITITDDGISRFGRSTCDIDQEDNVVDTAAEIDAIVAARSAIRSGAAIEF